MYFIYSKILFIFPLFSFHKLKNVYIDQRFENRMLKFGVTLEVCVVLSNLFTNTIIISNKGRFIILLTNYDETLVTL